MNELFENTSPGSGATLAYRESRQRRLPFSGIRNFRDLGGYPTIQGNPVRWGVLYRSDSLHQATNADLRQLSDLGLERIVDFRSPREKETWPDRLPADMLARLVEIPIIDTSTQFYQSSRDEIIKNLKSIDPFKYLTETNVQFATQFTPEIRKFLDILLASNGRPILFHCTAGKDRTGFAAALTLRMLGVPKDIVMEDYLLSNRYFYPAHRWRLALLRLLKGKQVAEVVSGMLKADPAYLSAAFQTIDQNHGSFDHYVHDALGLTTGDVDRLKSWYLG